MILSNTAIYAALDDGRLGLDPEPSPRQPALGGPVSPFDATSVDLRLGSVIKEPAQGTALLVDLTQGDVPRTLGTLFNDVRVDPVHGYRLEPNQFVLGQTMEIVRLPLPEDLTPVARGRGCLAARVEGKSSRARFGLLIHFTAPTIHAGWDGHITLEMMNLGPTPLVLKEGMPICQLILETVDGEPSASPSQFHGQ